MARRGKRQFSIWRRITPITTSFTAVLMTLSLFFITESYRELKKNSDDISDLKGDMKVVKSRLNIGGELFVKDSLKLCYLKKPLWKG